MGTCKKTSGEIGWSLKNIFNPDSKSGQDDPNGRWVSLGAKFPQDLVGFLNLKIEKSKVLVNPYAGVGYLKYEDPKFACSNGTCSISANGQLILKFNFLKPNVIKIIFSTKVVGDGVLPDAQVKESDMYHILEEGSILYRL